jgi:hypothetical protein
LFGLLTWGLAELLKKLDCKSDKKDLESLKEVLMSKIKSEEDVKHEILTTMYNISGTIENIDKKFDSKLDRFNNRIDNFGNQLIEHIQFDQLRK